jgi:hypothetical protein
MLLRLFVHILLRIDKRLTHMEEIMSTVPAGLAALQAADANLAAAVSAAVADIAGLSAQLTALNTEDPAVAAIAADLQSKVDALNAAVNPPAPPAPTV